jgi:predicted DNA-binding transcriptional regulator YafY
MAVLPLDNFRPPTRPHLRRLLWYRERLTAGDGFTAGEATQALECSERTVYRDMGYLRTLDWDVDFSRARQRWILASQGAPMPLLTLREGEMVALLVAEEALRSYAGTPYAASLRSAFQKIDAVLDAPVTLDLSQARLPGFAGPPARPLQAQQFDRLCRCCERRQRIEIDYYVPERDEITRRTIDPYHVFTYGQDWYIAAFDHLRGELRTFALGERMREIRALDENYTPDPAFDLDRYLAEGFGIFRGGPVEDVRLRFSPLAARYMKERVWDETEEKEELPDGCLLLKMRVPVNIGLLRFVLQYGAEVEAQAPESLRQQLREETARLAGIYRLGG